MVTETFSDFEVQLFLIKVSLLHTNSCVFIQDVYEAQSVILFKHKTLLYVLIPAFSHFQVMHLLKVKIDGEGYTLDTTCCIVNLGSKKYSVLKRGTDLQ